MSEAQTGGVKRSAPAPFVLSTQTPRLAPYNGSPILVNLVVNIEHWTLDKPMPRAVLPAPHGLSVVPDVANHSWVLYGLRAGLVRLARALEPLGTAVSVALNSDVIAHYPQVADLIEERGWEVLAHSVRQQSIQSFDDEAAVVSETIQTITDRFARPPRGWLSPGMNQTDHSLAHLARAGIEFCHDWMIDDRPTWLDSDAGKILGVPYTVELNDVTTYQVQTQPAGSLAQRVENTLAVYENEAVENPLVCAIGLHPHIMGVPHRIAEIERIVKLITDSPACLAVQSSDVADWYTAQVPAT